MDLKNKLEVQYEQESAGLEKNRQHGKLLAGKFCDLEGKIKKHISFKVNPLTLEGNLPCWRDTLHSLQGNKNFFQAWRIKTLSKMSNFPVLPLAID